MSSDTTDFHPGYLHPDTLEIMQGDNRLASQLGRHHDHHAASQRHREALSEHSPAVTPVLTPRAVLSSAMLVSVVDGGSVLTVGSELAHSLWCIPRSLCDKSVGWVEKMHRAAAVGQWGLCWQIEALFDKSLPTHQLTGTCTPGRARKGKEWKKVVHEDGAVTSAPETYVHLYIMPTLLLVHQHTGLPWYVNQLQACGRASAG